MTETFGRIERGQSQRFRPYASYRDSDIDWLGQTPASWNSRRLRFVVETRIPKKELRALTPATEVSFVPMEAIREFGGLDLDSTKRLSDVLDGYTYFRDGDVLVAKITPCFENGKGALAEGLSSNVGLGTTELHVLRPSNEVQARFLLYLTLSQHFRRIGAASMYGAGGQKRVSGDFIRNFRHPLPCLSEQRAIADFLDRETAKIDSLVAKKERLIGLLREERTALVTRAVTRGVDPDVPMKDSGVEWLGDVPAHWNVKRLKHLVPGTTVGIVVTPSKYYVDDGVPCLRSLNVSRGAVDTENLVFISESANELHRKSKIFAGDVVVVRTGQAGTAAVVPESLDGANCIDLLIVRRSDSILPRFVYYYLNSRTAISQAAEQSVGAIQAHYNTSTLARLVVPAIPLEEQRRIVEHLDEATGRIDGLVAKVNEAIDHLNEYRTALISATVTGKIDVREATPR